MRREDDDDVAGLIKRAQEGDETAFADLVHLYARRLYRFLRGRGSEANDAEDIVQETFIKAHRALRRYDSRYAFSTWLYTIARREAVSLYRRNRQAVAFEPLSPMLAATESETEKPDSENIWPRARRILGEREYEILWLRYGEDLSVKDAAGVMDVTPTHAGVILHRARKRLAALLDSDSEEGD